MSGYKNNSRRIEIQGLFGKEAQTTMSALDEIKKLGGDEDVLEAMILINQKIRATGFDIGYRSAITHLVSRGHREAADFLEDFTNSARDHYDEVVSAGVKRSK